MRFEYYVLNHDFNRDKIVLFNIFDNYYVQERTEKEIRKYLRSPKNYKYDSFFKNNSYNRWLNKRKEKIYELLRENKKWINK